MSVEARQVENRGRSIVVEAMIDGKRVRVIIPKNKLKNGLVEDEDWEKGVPFGADWNSLIKLTVTSDVLAEELRKRGVWTIDDYRRELHRGVQKVFLHAYMRDAVEVTKGVRNDKS